MKLTPLSDAIARFVDDGDLVYAADFTHLIPFAAGHEIIRQGRRDLTLCRATPDLLYDQMVAAGCARRLIFSWGATLASACCVPCDAPSRRASWRRLVRVR